MNHCGAFVDDLYGRVRPIDAADPEAREVSLPSSGELRLFVYSLKTATHHLDARWYLADLGVNRSSPADPDDLAETGRGGAGVDNDKRGELYRRTTAA